MNVGVCSGNVLTFVDLGHVHTGIVELQSGLKCREELSKKGGVLEERGRGGLQDRRHGHRGGRGARSPRRWVQAA